MLFCASLLLALPADNLGYSFEVNVACINRERGMFKQKRGEFGVKLSMWI